MMDTSKPKYGQRFVYREHEGIQYRWCPKAQHWKPLSMFPSNSAKKDGLDEYCKDCRNGYHRDIGLYRRHKYGITPEEFDAILVKQGNRCAICQDELVSPHLDHCHDTSVVRGILCRSCNHGLGNFRDNIEYLQRAIEYLLNGR